MARALRHENRRVIITPFRSPFGYTIRSDGYRRLPGRVLLLPTPTMSLPGDANGVGQVKANVVLVHGQWHDPRHFDLVVIRLRERGVTVAVPELHRGSLAADTRVVQEVVDALAPVVVLGHSYGGSVITGLTGVAHLVYVAAFVPDAGESAASLGRSTHPIAPAVLPADEGGTRLDPALAAEMMYAGCSPERTAWAVALLRTQAAGCGRGVPQRQSWRDTPSTYVVCSHDRAVDPVLQRQMAARCGSSVAWAIGHAPFVTSPDLVADLLTDLCTS
ncbi:alpha/beta hydrolase [Actinophytocola glycyrrhizae]|uniref:Alpha/beta hydrolase n=1 Tax=Actinophytocola glycyrrhizae TaxID=2044873 RepID=A0ABV9RW80_9PSEU